MTLELKTLKRQLTLDPTAAHYAEELFDGLQKDKEAEQYFSNAVQTHLAKYSQVPAIRSASENATNTTRYIHAVLDTFPSFVFTLCLELDKQEDLHQFSRLLRLAGIAATVNRKTDPQPLADNLLDQLNTEHTLEILKENISDSNTDPRFILKIIHQDFQQIIKNHPKYQTTKTPQYLIEVLFYFSGMYQLFLRPFFYLLWKAPNNTIAQHIHGVYTPLFLGLKKQEYTYWSQYKDGLRLRQRLILTVAKDDENNRHPQLRKHVFDQLKTYHPIIQDGSTRSTASDVRNLMMKQLAGFHSFSTKRLTLFLDAVQKCNGKNHINFLLTQLVRTDSDKFFQLNDYLIEQKQPDKKDLTLIVQAFSQKVPRSKKSAALLLKRRQARMQTVYKTADSIRQMTVKRNLAASEGNRGMTHDQVSQFLEDRLKKLYERVKIEGALTHDKIPEYLARFARAAETIVGPIPIGSQKAVVEDFKSSTHEILQEISAQGLLTEQEIVGYKTDIEEKAEQLNTPDVEERTELVDEIGVTLSEASFESDKRKEAAERDAFLKKSIIPYGLDKKAKRMSVAEFFTFPFGDYNGPEEDDWFDYHMRYLQMAVKANKLNKSNFVKIFNLLSHLPQVKYRKYFNIFPNDQFEETTFMAVYDLWQNKAFEKLRIE